VGIYTTVRHIGSTLVGIYYHCTHREVPWWVYTPLYTGGGTLVGIYTSIHIGRHPGGYIRLLHPREAPWWVYPTKVHPREAPWWYISLDTPRETPWWVYTSLYPREAPWWVYTPLYTTRFTVGLAKSAPHYHPFHCWVRKPAPRPRARLLSPVSLLADNYCMPD